MYILKIYAKNVNIGIARFIYIFSPLIHEYIHKMHLSCGFKSPQPHQKKRPILGRFSHFVYCQKPGFNPLFIFCNPFSFVVTSIIHVLLHLLFNMGPYRPHALNVEQRIRNRPSPYPPRRLHPPAKPWQRKHRFPADPFRIF